MTQLFYALDAQGNRLGAPLEGFTPPLPPPRDALAGRYCRLEPLSAARHAAALYAANATDRQAQIWAWLPYGPYADLDAYRAWVEAVASRDDPLFFAIIDNADARPLGVASYLRIDPPNASIEVGHICFSPLMQRRRMATEALYLLMANAFALGYRRYEWKCNALNTRSCRAAERLGLSFEGVFRQAAVIKQRNRDTAWFAAIDHEWPPLQAAFTAWLAPQNFRADGSQIRALSELTQPLLSRRMQDGGYRMISG